MKRKILEMIETGEPLIQQVMRHHREAEVAGKSSRLLGTTPHVG